MKLTHRPRQRRVREVVAGACGLFHTEWGVRSVHVVGPTRPTYRQLLRYRKVARNDHVFLVVDGDGAIIIRPEEH